MIAFDMTELKWREIKFGLDHQFIKPKVALEKADDDLTLGNVSKDILALADLKDSESSINFVTNLAKNEQPCTDQDIRQKWIYLILAWLFENRIQFVDPLTMVEEIYALFDYPREMEPFIRYMPMQGTNLGNKEQNEARMFEHWGNYLSRMSENFKR